MIWLYPEKPSIKDILSKPHVLSIITSVMGNKKFILWTCYVKIAKVNTGSDIFILFLNRHNVSNPVWVVFFSNETIFGEFVNFNFDCIHDVGSKSSLLLLNRFSVRFDIKMMHGYNLRVETMHVFITPSKDIYIFLYERYKVSLLC